MTNSTGESIAPLLLIVDDEPALLEMMQEIFHYAGYQVDAAASADQAIQILKTTDTLPNLIITDLLMPKIDGYQFMLSVRSEAPWQDIPFLFISGQETAYLYEQPPSMGIIGYLSKPFKVDDLLTIVAQAIEDK